MNVKTLIRIKILSEYSPLLLAIKLSVFQQLSLLNIELVSLHSFFYVFFFMNLNALIIEGFQ